MTPTPTREQIEAARTAAGGWTRAQLTAWGVPWPPPAGWKRRLEARADRVAAESAELRRSCVDALRRL